ncbi:MAG: hypothetical protein ACM3S5_09645 [Rhodospirillales bacterium]
MRFPVLAAWILWTAAARPEVIDRIAVTVDNQPIAESRVVEELRLTAFLNGAKAEITPQAKRAAADRLVEQTLIRREMQLTQYPPPDPAEVESLLEQVMAPFGSQAAFEQALKDYGIGREELKQALERQAAVLRFIDLRFRPEVQVIEPDIRLYYDTVLVPQFQKQNLTPPSYDEAHSQCEEAVISRRVDERVDSWLAEMKKRTRIRYEEDAFQ